jgi:hypothetical protein
MRLLYSGSDAQARAFRPPRMLPVDAFQQHRQLRGRQMDFTVTGHRPDEAPPLQPFDEQAQTVTVGPQHLYHVTTPAVEDKKVPAERVHSQRVLHFRRQPIEAAAHIRHAGDQPDARASRKVNHASPSLSSLMSARSSSGVSGPVRLRLPPGSVSLQLMTGGWSADTAPLCLGGGESGSTATGMRVALLAGGQQPLTMETTPVKHQVIVNTMFPRQFCHAGTRLQTQLRHADFELQWPVRTAFFDRQVYSKIEGVELFFQALMCVFLRQWLVNAGAAKTLEHFMRSGRTDVQLLSDFKVSQSVVKPQAECSNNPGSTGVRRVSVHGSVHVRESAHGRKHGQKWKTVWIIRLRIISVTNFINPRSGYIFILPILITDNQPYGYL